MMTNQIGCKDFLMQNRQRFGITENNLKTEHIDICVKQVRCIASRAINEEIVLPSMSNFINSCTGLIDSAGGIDTRFASLRVTHAHEELVECDTNCPGVKVAIKGQIIVRTRPQNCACPPSYMAIPVELCSEIIRDFYSTQTGDRVQNLKNELPNIDGSCMVINLNCRVYREMCNGSSRYVAAVTGSVVDKLWKMENIWVEGVKPYNAPSITVCEKFEKDFCAGCDDECTGCACNGGMGAELPAFGCDCGGLNGTGADCTVNCGCSDNPRNGCNTNCCNTQNNCGSTNNDGCSTNGCGANSCNIPDCSCN